MPASDVRVLVDDFFRTRWRATIAVLTRRFGTERLDDIENAVQAALVKALDAWSVSGVPDNPGGWIFAAARNHLLDALRRAQLENRHAERVRDSLYAADGEAPVWAHPLDDDVLKMILVCSHPRLSARESVVITLRLVCGLGVEEIAAGTFATVAATRKRLTRAKQRLRDEPVPFDAPSLSDPDTRMERLGRVLQILYLLFNEGYAAHGGDALTRPELCVEARRLADLLLESAAAADGRVWALAALMAFQASRLRARVDAQGRLLLLGDQDRALWDRALIARGFAYLEQSTRSQARSRYHLEAAIAACHAAAPTYATTDWARVLEFYDDLRALAPSPMVELNRAVAVMMLQGPDAGLRALEPLCAEAELRDTFLLPAVQADFHRRAGRAERATALYREALARNSAAPVRRFLSDQLSACSIQ